MPMDPKPAKSHAECSGSVALRYVFLCGCFTVLGRVALPLTADERVASIQTSVFLCSYYTAGAPTLRFLQGWARCCRCRDLFQ